MEAEKKFLLAVFVIFCAIKVSADNNSDLITLKRKLASEKENSVKVKILIDLGYHFLVLPGEFSADLKNAKNYCVAARRIAESDDSDSLRADVLLLDSQIEREKGNRLLALQKVDSSINLYSKIGDLMGQGMALMEKRYCYDLDDPGVQNRIEVLKKAADLFVRSGNSLKVAECYLDLGDLYTFTPQLDVSLQYLKKSLAYFNAAKYQRTHNVYDLIGGVSTAIGLHGEGLKNGLTAVKIGEGLKDTSSVMSTIYNRVGITYTYLGDYEKGYLFYQKGLNTAFKNRDNDAVSIISENLVHLLARWNVKSDTIGRFLEHVYQKYPVDNPAKKASMLALLASTYYDVDKDRSRAYLKHALLIDKGIANQDDYQKVIYSIAFTFFLNEKQYEKAKIYLFKYRDNKAGLRTLASQRLYYSCAYKLDSALGNIERSFDNFRLFKIYSDSIFNQRIRREVTMATAEYDLDKKDAELKLKSENINLLVKDNETHKELLRVSNLVRNITIAVIVLLILFLATLYNRWRNNRRNSEIIAQKNQSLQQLVNEKDWLVKEIHHRVKNNLQMIMSLIESQASYLQNDAKEAVMDSQHRINSMSLIHQKLYLVDNSTTINMQVYIEELVNYLIESFGRSSRVSFFLDVDLIDLDVSSAVPMGLILNEAITNSIKYAFPDERKGNITITLKTFSTDKIRLTIADDGIGLPADFNSSEATTLGWSLMHGLTTEIGGELVIDGSNGTSVMVLFPLPAFVSNNTYA
jgi:two-component sensor histidine kinase